MTEGTVSAFSWREEPRDGSGDDRFHPPVRHSIAGPDFAQRVRSLLVEPIGEAQADTAKVDKIDQWLRDKGVRVRRDTRDFKPGQQLPNSIEDAVIQADKVIVVYSANSKDRDWPRFEVSTAERVESDIGDPGLLIYLVLDDTLLPKHDPNRIAVLARGKSLKAIGEELLRGITRTTTEPERIDFDENQPL